MLLLDLINKLNVHSNRLLQEIYIFIIIDFRLGQFPPQFLMLLQ